MKLPVKISQPLLLTAILFINIACQNGDPIPENIPEFITKVVLTFSPEGSGSIIKVTATDPDGGGVQDIKVDGPINLLKNNNYTLSLALINELYKPGDDDYDVTEAIKKEGEEHQFFFSFSEGAFSSPIGAGNIKDYSSAIVGSINYLDKDLEGLPIGIETSWITSNTGVSSKSFRVLLKHQPAIKSSSSTSTDGESDLDILFELNVN